MNVRLKKEFAFNMGLIFEGQYGINQYLVRIGMITHSDDHRQQNIAYERIKYWTHRILDSAVIMSHDCDLLSLYLPTGQRVITVPEAPVDQIVGIMLYSKYNAMVEGRMVITDVEISSSMGDGMIYLHNEHENLGPFVMPGWWQDPRPSHCDPAINERGNKVVTLGRSMDWKDIDLDWEEISEESNTVVFADFKRDETK